MIAALLIALAAGQNTGQSAASDADFTLLYTGASRGIGSGRYDFALPERVARALEADETLEGHLLRAVPHHGVLAQGSFILIAEDRRIATLLDLLSSGGISCAETRSLLSIRTGGERLMIPEGEKLPRWTELISGSPSRSTWGVRRCTAKNGKSAELYAPFRFQGATEPEWKLDRFEVRLGLALELEDERGRQTLDLIGIPTEDAARRFRRLETLRNKLNAIYVDAGAFVDGSSTVREGQLSLHRPLGFEILKRLKPTALVPGHNELVAGAEHFLQEVKKYQLPYLATNWTAKNPALELPKYIIVEVPTSSAAAKVAFLGALDPLLAQSAEKLSAEEITIDDPVSSLNRAVSDLRSLADPPDVIIVLTIAGDEVRRDLEAGLRGVDLIIGEPDRRNPRAKKLEVEVSSAPEDTAPLSALPIFGISSAELSLRAKDDRYTLSKIAVRPHRTNENTPPDAQVVAAVTKTRAAVYPALDHPLLAAPPGGPLDTIGDGEWAHLVCETVRDTSDADVVLLAELPHIPRIPGPQTELMVADRLGVLDELERHYVPGFLLTDLLREARGVVTTACGGQIGMKAPLVLGRGIDPDALYSVVTTDRTRLLHLGPLLAATDTHRLLDRTGPYPVLSESGEPLTLRGAVIGALKALAAESSGGLAPLEVFDTLSALEKSPLWMFRMTRASARVERFEGIEDDRFAMIPETLATAVSSLTIGVELDASLIYDAPSILGELRARSTYARIKLEEMPRQELADDLKLSSSAALPGLSGTFGPFRLMPFAEVLLDTELTVEDDRPRQKDLFFTGGGALTAETILRSFRLGGFVLRDLAKPEGLTEFGARATGDTLMIIGPELRFTTVLDATYWANTGEDDATDLRYRATLEARLALPLARWLDIGIFGRIFAIRGRIPATAEDVAAITAGFSADLHGAFSF